MACRAVQRLFGANLRTVYPFENAIFQIVWLPVRDYSIVKGFLRLRTIVFPASGHRHMLSALVPFENFFRESLATCRPSVAPRITQDLLRIVGAPTTGAPTTGAPGRFCLERSDRCLVSNRHTPTEPVRPIRAAGLSLFRGEGLEGLIVVKDDDSLDGRFSPGSDHRTPRGIVSLDLLFLF